MRQENVVSTSTLDRNKYGSFDDARKPREGIKFMAFFDEFAADEMATKA